MLFACQTYERVVLNPIEIEYGSMPLGFAARGGQVEIVNILLKAGANPGLPQEPAWAKPLSWAKTRNHSAVAELLEQMIGFS